MKKIILLLCLLPSIAFGWGELTLPQLHSAGVLDVSWYGVDSNPATDDTTKLQAAFDAAAGKTLSLKKNVIYKYSVLTIKPNTTIISNGATFSRSAASTSHGITINSGVTVDRLVFTSPGGATGDKGIRIVGGNVNIGTLSGIAASEGNFNSTNYMLEMESNLAGMVLSNIKIGTIISTNWRTAAFVKNVDNLRIDSATVYKYRTAFYLKDVTNSYFGPAKITGLSTTLTGSPGENGLLIESSHATSSSHNLTFNGWLVEDSGEHGYRLGGQLTISDVYFRNCVSRRPGRAYVVAYPSATEWHGGCGFKVLGATSVTGQWHKNIHFDNCTVIDTSLNVGTFPTGHGGNNFSGFLISCAQDVFLANCKTLKEGQPYSGYQSILLESSKNIHITNCNFEDSKFVTLRFNDEVAGTSPGWEFGIEDLFIAGGVFKVGSGSGTGYVVWLDNARYAHKNWHFEGVTLKGGMSAFRIETPTTGSYSGSFILDIIYEGSEADNATYTSPIIQGAAVGLLRVVGPWRAAAYNPSSLNGSIWQDTQTGNVLVKKGEVWTTTSTH